MRGRRSLAAVAALGVTLLLAAPARGADSVYWSTDVGLDNSIQVSNLDGSASASTLFADDDDLMGLAIDPAAGKVYWAKSASDGQIRVANLDGSGSPATLFGGEIFPRGIAIDPAAGKIYWASPNLAAIRVGNLDGSGSASTLFGGEANALSVAVDPAGGKIYWTRADGQVRVGNLDGSGSPSILFTESQVPLGVAVDPAGGKIYSTLQSGEIRVGNLDRSGSASDLYAGEASPEGLAIDPGAGKIYWAALDAVRVGNLDGSGSASTLFSDPDAASFAVLLRTPSGTGPPTISGTGELGQELSCSQGSWGADLLGAFLYRAPRSFAYQWQRDGGDIAGATQPTYTPTEAGSYTCRVTATNQAGSTSQTSSPVTVASDPDGTPTGPTVDELLTADCRSAGAGVAATQPILAGPSGGELVGTEAQDMILGGQAADEIFGLAAADCMRARRGKDEVDGGTGRDVMYGGRGGDRMDSSSPERDQVRCGKGRDQAEISRNDRTRGCEEIETV